MGGGGSEQLLDPAEQRLFSQFLDELVQNPNPFDSSSSASSASTSSSLPQQQPFLPHFPTSSSSGMVMPPSPTLVPASPSSSSSLPSFSSSSYSATARISANWLNPSTLPSPQGFQSLFTLPTQRPLSSSPLPSHNHNSNNLNHNSSPNGNVKGFAPQNAFPFQAPAPVAAPKTVKNNPSEGSSPTSTKPKESSDPMATLEENGYETMVFGFSGEEMQQTKVVRGAITPQALKMGMRSAVKSKTSLLYFAFLFPFLLLITTTHHSLREKEIKIRVSPVPFCEKSQCQGLIIFVFFVQAARKGSQRGPS